MSADVIPDVVKLAFLQGYTMCFTEWTKSKNVKLEPDKTMIDIVICQEIEQIQNKIVQRLGIKNPDLFSLTYQALLDLDLPAMFNAEVELLKTEDNLE